MNKDFKNIFVTFVFAVLFSFNAGAAISQVTDIDGNIYKTVKIGTQEWTAENLKVGKFKNGDLIRQAKTNDAWREAGDNEKPAWCYYENVKENGKIYGRLYNWYAINDKRGLAPEGWHIPSDAEWTILTDYLGGDSIAGGKLKSKSLWDKPNIGATDTAGFSALPGGLRFFGEVFNLLGNFGDFWSSTELNSTNAWTRYLDFHYKEIFRFDYRKRYGLSVRCIKD